MEKFQNEMDLSVCPICCASHLPKMPVYAFEYGVAMSRLQNFVTMLNRQSVVFVTLIYEECQRSVAFFVYYRIFFCPGGVCESENRKLV